MRVSNAPMLFTFIVSVSSPQRDSDGGSAPRMQRRNLVSRSLADEFHAPASLVGRPYELLGLQTNRCHQHYAVDLESAFSANLFCLAPFGGFPEGRSPQASLVAAGNSFFSVSDSGGTGHSGLFETLIVGIRGRARLKLLRGSENQSARSIVNLRGRNCVTKVCVEAFLTGNLEKRAFHSFHRIATCS